MYNDIRRTPLIIRLPASGGQAHPGLCRPGSHADDAGDGGAGRHGDLAGRRGRRPCSAGSSTPRTGSSGRDHPRQIADALMRGETARGRDIAAASNTLIRHTPVLASAPW